MNSRRIEVFYSTPKIEGKEAFFQSEIEQHIISEFAKKLVDKIEKTEREHCIEYRLNVHVLTDEQLLMMVNSRALQMMLDNQII